MEQSSSAQARPWGKKQGERPLPKNRRGRQGVHTLPGLWNKKSTCTSTSSGSLKSRLMDSPKLS